MRRVSLMFAALLGACDGDGDTCASLPRPLATPVNGDANGDGVADITDGVALHDALFRRGQPPACVESVDLDRNGVLDAGDGIGIWYHLFFGNTVLYPMESTCEAPAAGEEVCGGDLALAIEAPAEASGPFEATVTLKNPAFEVRAWSLSLTADGCTVTAATTAATAAADRREDPPGLRDGGMAMAELLPGGLVAATAMDIPGDAVLPQSEAPQAVLKLTIEADSCGTCRLTLRDGLRGAGQPVNNVVTALGRSYTPALGSAQIEACP